MPHGEHSAGNGSQRILCKVCGGQTGCKAGVLHAHLDGDRAALGGVQLEQLAHAKAGEVAQHIVQDDHHKDQQTAGHDLGAVGGDHGADDQHDGGSGDQRQHADGFLGELMEEVIFKFFFTHGFVLDTLLSWVGFNVDKLPFWLRDESINNVVLVACSIWKYIGQNIVMFIGAIASVDPVLYEAAEIDGANAWHRFKDIILPSISTIVVLNLIISVSGALSAFEMPYVVTGGGFNTSTYFVVMDKIAHTDQKVGLASAMAVVLLLLIVIVTYAQKAVEKWLENRSSGVTK